MSIMYILKKMCIIVYTLYMHYCSLALVVNDSVNNYNWFNALKKCD